MTSKTNKIPWDQYFMSLAFVAAQRSPDPRTKHGAIIVNEQYRVLGMGYNGHPRGGINDLSYDWDSDDKYDHVIHAELNAILNCVQPPIDGTIYITGRPCVQCALAIAQSGIKTVIFGPVESRMDVKWAKTKKIFHNHFIHASRYDDTALLWETLNGVLSRLGRDQEVSQQDDTDTTSPTE